MSHITRTNNKAGIANSVGEGIGGHDDFSLVLINKNKKILTNNSFKTAKQS